MTCFAYLREVTDQQDVANQSLQRSVPERRYPILVAFLLRTYEKIIDELIELFDRCLADRYTRASMFC